MAAGRPFPPSARRRALARAAGLHAASPVLVGAIACSVALIALLALGRAAIAQLASWLVAACEGSARLSGPAETTLPTAVLSLALPVLGAGAIAAIAAHLVQARAVWLPRRRVTGAPTPSPHRVRRAALDLVAAAVIAGVAFGWLWTMAPRLAALPVAPLAGVHLVASALAALAIAWLVLGVGDAVVRHLELAAALRMTPADKREDDRLAGADPRWRARRQEIARGSRDARSSQTRDAVAGASVLVLGDDVAVAIAWDPVHRPVPVRTAAGRDARATQLLALARRHAIPVHRDPALAAALARARGEVPEAHWPRLADIVAATRGRTARDRSTSTLSRR